MIEYVLLPLRKRKRKLKSQDAQMAVKTFKKKVKKFLTKMNIHYIMVKHIFGEISKRS